MEHTEPLASARRTLFLGTTEQMALWMKRVNMKCSPRISHKVNEKTEDAICSRDPRRPTSKVLPAQCWIVGWYRASVSHHNILRFLWVKDIREAQSETLELQFTCVVFLLSATIHHHLENSEAHLDVIAKLLKGFYVNNLITNAEDEAEAFHLYKTAKEIMKTGGFNLRKFVSHLPLVQARIADIEASHEVHQSTSPPGIIEADETFAQCNLSPGERVLGDNRKVMGMCCDVRGDYFVFSFESLSDTVMSVDQTKRIIARAVGKSNNPLGFLTTVGVCF